MCINTQTKKNPKYGTHALQPYLITYPCGKCPLCVRKRLSNWIFRIQKEQQRSLTTSFITLTYDDEHLPHNQSVNKRDIQLFHKRLRKYRESESEWDNYPLRYICVSEYGTQSTQRPHYHIIAFNYPTHKDVEKIWGNGFITIGNVTYQSAGYVASYITKKSTGPQAIRYGMREPEFALMSRRPGLGRAWFEEFASDALSTDKIILSNGLQLPLPKYYDSIIKQSNPQEMEAIKCKRKALLTPESFKRLNDRKLVMENRLKQLKREFENDNQNSFCHP